MAKLALLTCVLLLACNDQRDAPPAKRQTPSKSVGLFPGQSWTVTKEVNPVDSTVALDMSLDEIDKGRQRTPRYLSISCRQGEANVFVITLERSEEVRPQVRYRIDSDSIVTAKWVHGGLGIGVIDVMGARSLVKRLIGAKRFAFEVLSPNATAEFDVSQLREHLADIKASCPKGAVPPA